ncbi:hypothetical protein LTR10_017170 [Elasticomyces elasticus]|uniref:C2 NT-type domain-containing protein n=1 Tax=Exophiala sideris TaxID=1016849 RepID=A0ABR0J5M8_9EURO|nr:hypothetical protein LTR10_017170 [Elasticomyces elasticus]KAK5028474.1 hypothetical protein LTS07_006565 [Exophiala sideris]KAK5035884.1 hypothetical protein LTR13_005454 [Exophiala sideris]KAK5056920.1 hypothetical protein LTR69_007558 [Exophiala sideris]KAK5181327.1 hypothetical protein LTR44_006122 [Eurotiomycetes sp. CCFEE 6388]
MQAFVPKNRKPKFDLTLRIIDLTNIPLIYGTVSVRWHLPSSNAAEHRGRTEKAAILEHRATWDYNKDIPVRLTIDKTGMLQECELQFEILQEFDESGRGGRVHLGNVKLNLAEYARLPEDAINERDAQDENEDGGITRRYLLQDSKVNSTLKIGIKMKQTEGDTNFIAPPLKSAMVIGGIAGVLSTEAAEGDDIPSITSKTRELSEAQDIYRRTLAATWACQAGELPPDKLIEDIFAGNSGGRLPAMHKPALEARMGLHEEGMERSSSSDEMKRPVTPPQRLMPQTAHRSQGHRRVGSRDSPNATQTQPIIGGRSSIEQQMQASQQDHRRRDRPDISENSEFELRDNLRSWQVRVR